MAIAKVSVPIVSEDDKNERMEKFHFSGEPIFQRSQGL